MLKIIMVYRSDSPTHIDDCQSTYGWSLNSQNTVEVIAEKILLVPEP